MSNFPLIINRLIDYCKIVIWGNCVSSIRGQINNVFPAYLLLKFTLLHSFIFPKVVTKDPLKDAIFIFTDGSSNGRTTYVVNGERHIVQTEPASLQIVELQAVTIVLQLFADMAFKLHADSEYILILFKP